MKVQAEKKPKPHTQGQQHKHHESHRWNDSAAIVAHPDDTKGPTSEGEWDQRQHVQNQRLPTESCVTGYAHRIPIRAGGLEGDGRDDPDQGRGNSMEHLDVTPLRGQGSVRNDASFAQTVNPSE